MLWCDQAAVGHARAYMSGGTQPQSAHDCLERPQAYSDQLMPLMQDAISRKSRK